MNISNISNLNNSNALQNVIDISGFVNKKNKTITGDKFYVGEGILRCDNYFVSLDSVCIVELVRRQNPILFFVSMVVIGFIFSIILFPFGTLGVTVGILMIVFGTLGIYFIRKLNEKMPYSMVVHLNDNSTYTYNSLNKEFILDVIDVIQSCINDRRGGYNILMNQGKIERNDNSITIGGSIIDSNVDVIAQGGSKIIKGNSNNTVNKPNNNTGLTAEDWMNLEKFFMMRRKEFPADDKNYKICSNLVACSQRKDAGTMKRYLQTIGKEAVRIIFTASTNVAAMEVVRPIINKILSLKG